MADVSGREEAIESGRKVTCVVSQVLFHEQVRVLEKSPEWFVFEIHVFSFWYIFLFGLIFCFHAVKVLEVGTIGIYFGNWSKMSWN